MKEHNLLPCLLVLIFSLALTIIVERFLIPVLSGRAKQPIYEGGPAWHLSKSGTPTMGGLAFIISIIITVLPVSMYFIFYIGESKTGFSLLLTLIFSLGNSIIGIFDDAIKLRRKENAGLSPLQKLVLQFLLAILFLMARRYLFGDTTVISFPFFDVDLGIFYYPLAVIILLGIVNCANLTDGIDGLASSVALTIGSVLFLVLCATAEISVISAAMAGATLGFLFFNVNPAQIFMGDTGSLFLGALVASLAFSLGNPFIAILLGGVYVIEGVSVILQVAFFKLTRRRIFKMAPLHHHLEKCGLTENRICILAVCVTLLLSSFALLMV